MWMWTWEHVDNGHVDIDNGHVDVRTCGHGDMCIRGCGQWTCGCVMSTCGQAPTCEMTQHYNRGGIIIKTIT